MEDSSENSGQRFITVVNGTAAGGGYELALATDHIILADDGSASVALPEVPLLAVLPGTGGLTRVVDKRKVRRDHADFFCTIEEGIKGKRAVQWRLVDEIVPNSKLEAKVAERAKEFAAASQTQRQRQGHRADAAHAQSSAIPAFATTCVSVDIDRAAAHRHHFDQGAGGRSARRHRRHDRARGVVLAAAGGARARRRDPASAHQRARDRACWCSSRMASRAHVLAYDAFLEANKAHWLVNEIRHYWKRVLKRIDVTSRTLVTLVEPGSCFAGTLAELVFARRPLLHADRLARRATTAPPPAIAAHRDEFRPLSDEPRPDAACSRASRPIRPTSSARSAKIGTGARRRAGRRARPRHLRARRHRLGRRDPRVPGGAHELLARQPHRHGSEPALRRPGDHGIENLLRA